MNRVLRKALVAIDGSDAAAKAIDLAVELGRTYGCELLFCHVVDDFVSSLDTAPSVMDVLRERGEQLLAGAVHHASGLGLHAKSALLSGRPESVIVDAAVREGADAIVMGTHGREGMSRFFMGSTAESVLRISTLPVFIVHADFAPAERVHRIVAGIDNSEPSDAAADYATALGAAAGARVTFAHVVDESTLFDEAANFGGETAPVLEEWTIEANALANAAARRAGEGGLANVETDVTTGDPAKELIALAERQQAGLIVVGAHGRRGRRRMLVGSVMLQIVRRSNVPIVVVRDAPGSAGAPAERADVAAGTRA